MLTILLIGSALLNLFLVALRLVEAIYQVRKNEDLDTFQECIAVVKNFFKIS